jgi:hypothetical protein
MKADYKARRAAKQAEQKSASRNARSHMAALRNHPTHQWKPTPLRDAAHEIGHGALSIPESEWHLGLGTYSQCPACDGLPPMDTHGLSLAAHQRNVTRGNTPAYEIDPFEALYYAVAGGVAEAVCFGDEPMPFLFYSGNPNPFPYGMDDDFRTLRNKAPNLLAVAHLAYRDLYEFLRPHRAALLSYAEQLVERASSTVTRLNSSLTRHKSGSKACSALTLPTRRTLPVDAIGAGTCCARRDWR